MERKQLALLRGNVGPSHSAAPGFLSGNRSGGTGFLSGVVAGLGELAEKSLHRVQEDWSSFRKPGGDRPGAQTAAAEVRPTGASSAGAGHPLRSTAPSSAGKRSGGEGSPRAPTPLQSQGDSPNAGQGNGPVVC